VFTRKTITKLSLSPEISFPSNLQETPISPNPHPPAQMATSSRSSTDTPSALSLASKCRRTTSSLAPVYSSISIKILTAFLEGIGLVISPSLPIVCNPFKFLKSLDLTLVGLGLNEIPFDFGWELVIWKSFGVQFGSKAILGPNEAGFDVVDVLDESFPSEDDGHSDTVRVKIGPEPVSEMGDLGIGPEPVPKVSEAGVEPPSVFVDHADMSFDKVADFEGDEEVDPPVVILQPKTISLPQPSEGPRKKRIKTLVGYTDFPLVR